ncbi:hypothetical protein ADIMK_0248 [Marinobacterium lacunae]|uniref:Uncharacterized protein n=1 Tax=Marinobacterium lacunae TaxID=1232683 RepID=A0A081G3D6_9GAMM|nr:hypothetical protein ADIMK_0248 [Marinobacterium lacunae]
MLCSLMPSAQSMAAGPLPGSRSDVEADYRVVGVAEPAAQSIASGSFLGSHGNVEIDYHVVEVAKPAALPEVTVVYPSEPLPVHEIVVEPVNVAPLAGEELVFAQIQKDALLPDIDVLSEEAPGPSLVPPPPFGTHRNVIEL